MLKKSAETPKQIPQAKTPYRAYVFARKCCYKHCEEIRRNTQAIRRNTQAKTPQANKPYGTEEGFEIFKVSA